MSTNVEGYLVRNGLSFLKNSSSMDGVGANGDPLLFVVGVVIKNPYAGKFSQDLSFGQNLE